MTDHEKAMTAIELLKIETDRHQFRSRVVWRFHIATWVGFLAATKLTVDLSTADRAALRDWFSGPWRVAWVTDTAGLRRGGWGQSLVPLRLSPSCRREARQERRQVSQAGPEAGRNRRVAAEIQGLWEAGPGRRGNHDPVHSVRVHRCDVGGHSRLGEVGWPTAAVGHLVFDGHFFTWFAWYPIRPTVRTLPGQDALRTRSGENRCKLVTTSAQRKAWSGCLYPGFARSRIWLVTDS